VQSHLSKPSLVCISGSWDPELNLQQIARQCATGSPKNVDIAERDTSSSAKAENLCFIYSRLVSNNYEKYCNSDAIEHLLVFNGKSNPTLIWAI